VKKKQKMKRKLERRTNCRNHVVPDHNKAGLAKRKGLYLLVMISAMAIGLILAIVKSADTPVNKGTAEPRSQMEGKIVTDRFMQMLANLPDDNARNNLYALISQRGLRVVPYPGKYVMAFEPNTSILRFNPEILSDQEGYIWSYMVHENRHIEDWQNKHESGKLYSPCELENYTTHQCKLEWWDAEFRALEQQAIFLKKNRLTQAMPIGPSVNNRAIFENNNVRLAALIFLRKNYYEGRSTSLDLLEVFQEFYNKKLAEIS